MRVLTSKRKEILEQLIHYMGESNLQDAHDCSRRLVAMLPDQTELKNNGVFVAYGGGKDSSYMVAFVRLLQLLIEQEYGSTFRLRVASNRHAGMPQAVMENIDRVYRALGLYEDAQAELLLIDGNLVRRFDKDLPMPAQVIEQNRTDILMTGHRCYGDARPTFCNACNLSMVNSFGVAISYGDNIQIVVTGDSKDEQKAYGHWVKDLLQKFGLEKPQGRGFKSFLAAVNEISVHYFKDIHGAENDKEITKRRISHEGILQTPMFFSIYEDTPYSAGDHWELLVDYLGFEFDELAFSFTESDCANPAIMAHLRGIKVEQLYGRTYEEGIEEYVAFTTGLMQKKEFPEQLIELAQSRYSDEEAIREMRGKIERYTLEAYGITNEQAVCMVYSPFASRGENLANYLQAQAPELLDQLEELHALLSDSQADVSCVEPLAVELQKRSGLRLDQLRVLYQSELIKPDRFSPIHVVLEGDPHKEVIQTRMEKEGPLVAELISGR